MNVFLREMKANRKSLIIWSLGIMFMIAAGMGKYSAMGANDKSINDMLTGMPKSVKAIFGVGNFDYTKASGFYGMLFLYLVLMAAIHAGMLGANIIAKEERDKTTEFLFVKPSSRFQIVSYKLLAALANIVIFNIVTLVLSVGIVNKYAQGESVNGDIFLLMIGMFMIQLIFLSIGTVLAAVSHNPKAASSIVTGIMLLTYILSVAIELNDKLEVFKYITPFKYFEASKIMYGGGLNPLFVVLSLGITVILGFLTYRSFNNRDLGI